jgi:ATP-dependent RNA helicase SUPV3L1/SUV3
MRAAETKSILTALLGPTNTGKTHYAVERLASYQSGMIGFPLRLLARENYDRLVGMKGRMKVALITGEEKIIPPKPQYYVCTVEAMPVSIPVEFLCVDEIQLCADAERGHIFTDRLLNARGFEETVFLGAATMTPLIKKLLPDCRIETRERLSPLTYDGHKKISRLKPRSAIVAFNVNDVYRLAEQVRLQRGGTAIVLGALSPRTRNAQVEMYQSGEVDYIVATDAIGMGLNMEIDHVALAATRKFDGVRPRNLHADELAQIAGRAGRYRNAGTFGTTDQVDGLEQNIVTAIENHQFDPVEQIRWRNPKLEFKSIDTLLKSLNVAPKGDSFIAARQADDHTALAFLSKSREIRDFTGTSDMVRRLWDVCAIPDFRKTLTDEHHILLARIFTELAGNDHLNEDWCAEQIARLDRTDGDLDTLLTRIAYTRTWTYITHVRDWVRDSQHWQAVTRQIEDRLSDALHEKLTQRFVDKRTSSLLRGLASRATLLGGIQADGTVIVEGHRIGQLQGWRFMADETFANSDNDAVTKTARTVLKEPLLKAVTEFAEAPMENLSLAADGSVLWQIGDDKHAVAKLQKGEAWLSPKMKLLHTDFLDDVQNKAILQKLDSWLTAHKEKNLSSLIALDRNEVKGAAKGIAFQLFEQGGVMLRSKVADMLAPMTKEERQILGNLGVRIGAYYLYQKDLLKPAALEAKAILWRIFHGIEADKSPLPQQGNVSMACPERGDRDFYLAMGFPVFGKTCVRVDMVDRVNSAVFDGASEGKYKFDPALASTVGVSVETIQFILHDLGFRFDDVVTGEGEAATTARFYHVKRKPPRLEAPPKKEFKKPEKKFDGKKKPHKEKDSAPEKPKAPTGHNPFAALAALKK